MNTLKMPSYSEKDIESAGNRVCNAISAATYHAELNDYEFSDEFQRKMDVLILKSKARCKRKNRLNAALAAMLTLILLSSIWIGTSPSARADLTLWLRKTFTQNEILYVFTPQSGELPQFSITWLPNGYFENEKYESGENITTVFMDNAGHMLILDCSVLKDDMHMEITGESLDYEEVLINGLQAELYTDEKDKSNVIMWADPNNSIVFTITGFIDSSELIQMAESIIYD